MKTIATRRFLLAAAAMAAVLVASKATGTINTCFEEQYSLDKAFAQTVTFANVSDIDINHKDQQVLVLQRSYPAVTVWSTEGSLVFAWDTQEIGYPHSLTIDYPDVETTVWITDMAGVLAAGNVYGHCIKQFTYTGKFIRSIGSCGINTNGSRLDPVQFDRVTDVAINSAGYMYITDGDVGGLNNRVLVFNQNYDLVDVWNKENKPGPKPLQFNLPHSIYIDWCDRLWIADTMNHRIQIISSNGTFLNEWNCFENSLLYGIDISPKLGYLVVTTRSISGESNIVFLPIQVDNCSQLSDIGNCTIYRKLAVKQPSATTGIQLPSSMLHSVSVDSATGSLYVSMLPGSSPPLKFSPVPLPPRSRVGVCPGSNDGPAPWPSVWSATVLLTPFFADEDLLTAHVEYNDDLHTMYIILYGPNGDNQEFLNVQDSTYTVSRNSNNTTCSEPHDNGWTTPSKEWLASYKCECKGELNISGIDTVAWTCPVHKLRNWYWVHSSNGSVWRILFNNESNPTRLPVIGEYTMAHFSNYGNEDTQLKTIYNVCKQVAWQPSNFKTPEFVASKGTSGTLQTCSNMTSFPSWPEFFHMTVTMTPVILNNATPLPTQVIYDWEQWESQHTIMCEALQTFDAYLIRNKTYITSRNLDTGVVQCLSHLDFGPPKPNWMTLDECKCKGIIRDDPALSPYRETIIAVCPLDERRVFWTWFTQDTSFAPLLFFETLTPADEGTGLALADYHAMHKDGILIDTKDFEPPSKCKDLDQHNMT